MNNEVGKTLIVIGAVVLITGVVFTLLPKDSQLPKLPGDIYIKRENFTFYFPWVTSLIISAILSLVFYLFFRR